MGGIIITKSDEIPTKKIVAVLGDVSARKAIYVSERPEKCFEELKKKAGEMGADGIINVTYVPGGPFGLYGSCHGLAVRLADADEHLCPKCKKELPPGKFKFCPHCGSSLI